MRCRLSMLNMTFPYKPIRDTVFSLTNIPQELTMATTTTVRDSSITLASIMLPKDGNPMGFVHGGAIAKLIDEAGAVVASRHAHKQVVTRSFDQLSFHHHVSIGNLLHLKASLNFVGNSSMEVGVRVEEEELTTGRVQHVASAYLYFVAIDERGRPSPVPPLLFETEMERRRNREAMARRACLLQRNEDG
ncbi:MAG: acyl-CoA thioesterase [Desulfobulbaceae bacterium]|jgi:acyl-CoA hydrolase|nr:acyl-CoA thioesterase [Desulfobulbaceae bacterium]